MTKKHVQRMALLALCSLFVYAGNAQVKIGDNPTSIATSSMLEVESTTKGFVPPRMTNAQMKAIANPVEGLLVYNTTLKCMAYYVDSSFNCTHNQPARPAPAAPTGSTYTAHFNGIISGVHAGTTWQDSTQTTGETFNNNTTCATKSISAQGCGGISEVTGVSGTVYPVTNINGQCWMTTNLKEVPSNFSSYTATSWLNTNQGNQGYWGYYNTATTNGSAGWGISEPAAGEGLLYQWSAAMDNSLKERTRGVCPTGFHVPSDCEWMYLEHGQGMALSEQVLNNTFRSNAADNQGTPGYKLRSQGTGQTNVSGFSSLLAGTRNPNGSFSSRASYGDYWTSSLSGSLALYRSVLAGFRGVARGRVGKLYGFSVRCLKD